MNCPDVTLLCIKSHLSHVVSLSTCNGFLRSFLANVIIGRPSVHLSVCHLSSVCNVRAPYSGDLNFRQSFYTSWYAGHLLTSR